MNPIVKMLRDKASHYKKCGDEDHCLNQVKFSFLDKSCALHEAADMVEEYMEGKAIVPVNDSDFNYRVFCKYESFRHYNSDFLDQGVIGDVLTAKLSASQEGE